MDIKELLSKITPEVYLSLKRSIEIGRWPDGRKLTSEQRSLSIQAVIAYEQDLPEHQKTGFVPHKKSACDSGVCNAWIFISSPSKSALYGEVQLKFILSVEYGKILTS